MKNPASDGLQMAATGAGGGSKLSTALEAASASGELDLSVDSGVNLDDLQLDGLDLSAVRKVSIKGQKVESFPPALLALSSLTDLDVSENLLAGLPEDLGSLYPALVRAPPHRPPTAPPLCPRCVAGTP